MVQAGDLTSRLRFGSRAVASDPYGQSEGDFVDHFDRSAKIEPRFGGEKVIADRLAGVQTVMITIPWDAETVTIAPFWRATDIDRGTAYDVKSAVDPNGRREWIELLAQSGGAV